MTEELPIIFLSGSRVSGYVLNAEVVLLHAAQQILQDSVSGNFIYLSNVEKMIWSGKTLGNACYAENALWYVPGE